MRGVGIVLGIGGPTVETESAALNPYAQNYAHNES